MTVPNRDTVADMLRRAVACELQTVDQAIGFYLQYFCVDETKFLQELDSLHLYTEEAGNLSIAEAVKKYLPKCKK
jgi:hypothetical protein